MLSGKPLKRQAPFPNRLASPSRAPLSFPEHLVFHGSTFFPFTTFQPLFFREFLFFSNLYRKAKNLKKHEKPPENFSSYLISSLPIVRCVVWKIFFQRPPPSSFFFTWLVTSPLPRFHSISFQNRVISVFASIFDATPLSYTPLIPRSVLYPVKFLQPLCFVDTSLYGSPL
jgi:hypothetical protein